MIHRNRDAISFLLWQVGHPALSYYSLCQTVELEENAADTAWLSNLAGTGYTVTLDSEHVYAGTYSLRLEKTSDSSETSAYTYRSLPWQSEEPATFFLRGYLKTEAVDESANLWVSVRDQYGNTLYSEDEPDNGARGTTDWREVSLPVLLDTASAELRVGIRLTGTGTAWFDRLILEKSTRLTSDTASSEALAYLRAAIDTIRQYSIMRDSIDWLRYRERLLAYTPGVRTVQDTYPIIRYGTYALRDRHSRFLNPGPAKKIRSSTEYEQPTGAYLGNGIGYLKVPPFSGSRAAADEYATILQNVIRDVDRQPVCGWIVDVRGNRGGNMYPMIAGVGPIVGEGMLGEFQASDTTEYWYYRNGEAGYGDTTYATVSNPYRLSQPTPVAVLTGPHTASSGEAVVVSFLGREDVKTFGLPTYGVSTANDIFTLSDGAEIVLTVATMADRTGQAYGGKILPDVTVDFSDTELPTDSLAPDSVVSAAVQWLRQQTTCQ